MKKIVVYNQGSDKSLERLSQDFPQANLVYVSERDELFEALEGSEVLVTFGADDEILDAGKDLKYVFSMFAGVDSLPLERMQRDHIVLTTGRGIHVTHMAEYAIMMMVMAARDMDQIFKQQPEHLWKPRQQNQIFGKKLGILGLGAIGQEIAKVASFLGMEVIGVRTEATPTEHVAKTYGLDEGFEVVCSTCDYIINLLPHTDKTHHIIDKRYFDMLKPEAVMINIGRGDTVNEADLYQALVNKQFKRYITDVFETEPLPEDSKFWELDNIVITPHIAGPIVNYLEKAYPIVRQNITAYLEDQPENLRNVFQHERGY